MLFVRDYSEELGDRHAQVLVDTYQKLRIVIAEVAKGEVK